MCAGQALLALCKKYHFERNILYVVDNYKKGERICINGCTIPIISVQEVGEEIKDVIPIITTIKYAKEIINQLDDILIFHDVPFLVPYFFQEETYSVSTNELLSHGIERIPKIIHYCWFGKSELPRKFRENIATWQEKCPQYEIKRWDESNYDISKNKYMKQAYDKKKWGFVPDFARLDIINTYGGIYLDTDVEVLKSFDALLSYDLFCGFENSEYVALGLGFGGTANNTMLKKMMEKYEKVEFVNKDGSLNLTASPIYQTEIMETFGIKRNGQTQIIGNSIVLAPEYLAPINPLGIGEPTTNSYSIHQYAATWFDEKQLNEKNKLMENIKSVLAHMK